MNFGVKVEINKLKDGSQADGIAVVHETLTRMGIRSKIEHTMTPSCYLWKEKGEYYICHFKELLSMFDAVPEELSEEDNERRGAICTLLQNWGHLEIIDTGAYQPNLKQPIFVLKHKFKEDYEMNHKFQSFDKLAILRGEDIYG